MITQEILNTELDLAKKIYIYYLDKLAAYESVGSNRYMSWYKDLCVLYYLTDQLQLVRFDNGLMYIGSQEIDEDDFSTITRNIREFIDYDVRDLVYAELDADGKIKDFYSSNPATPPVIVSYQQFNENWQSVLITVTEDNRTEFTVPFNIANVDTNALIVTVSTDSNPIPVVSMGSEGVTFVGSTMYWHTYYNVKAGDIIRIQYLVIS